ncbi:Alcohol dehydrogenase [bacterium HR24]|jgi:propanol-preferring alcohol dehydrogenase|nr:Alcohol dehydrogenase [bacterium HR24]
MRAMVLDEYGGPFRRAEVDVPKPGPGEALMRIRSTGVGLTLQNIRLGRLGPIQFPRIIGHETAGDIVEVGPGVDDLRPGDRCVVHFYLTCGKCKWCLVGRETLCSNHRGYVGVAVDGAFAEYIKLPARNFLPIPPEVDYEAAAVAADAICTPWHCFTKRARVGPLDDVLIIGAGGGVAIHAVQVAKLFGARVIAADISEEKLALARQYGADIGINVRERPLPQAVREVTDGEGVDVCVDFVGSPATAQDGIASLGTSGTYVIIGVEPGTFPFNITQLILPELTLTGSRYSSRQELRESIDLVARGLVKPVVGARVALEDVGQLFDMLEKGTLLGRGAIVY